MTYDAVQELEAAGIAVSSLNDQQRAVVADLSPGEVELVARINRRIADAGADDVEGHAVIGAGIF